MLKHGNSLCCQGNTVQWKLTIFTTKCHQGLTFFLTTFEVDVVILLGEVHQTLKHVISCRQYDYDWIMECRCLQARTHQSCGGIWGRLDNVPLSYNNLIFHGKITNWLPHHGHNIRRKLRINTTFHREGLYSAVSKFEVNLMNSLREFVKMTAKFKMAHFLLGLEHDTNSQTPIQWWKFWFF